MSSAVVAQQPDRSNPLDLVISVDFKKVKLGTALDRLRKFYGVPLAWSPDYIPDNRYVTLTLTNRTVRVILGRMLWGTRLKVEVVGGKITIAPSAPIPDPNDMPAHPLDDLRTSNSATSPIPERQQTSAITIFNRRGTSHWRFARSSDLLRYELPGLPMWDQGLTGPPPQIASIRGASSFTERGVKTYIDGIEVASPNLALLLSPSSIQMIEAIRGPQGAALYGSEAINGVLNIFTVKGTIGQTPKLQTTAAAGVGFAERSSISARFRQQYGLSLDWGGTSASLGATGTATLVGAGGSPPSTRNIGAHVAGHMVKDNILITGVSRIGKYWYTEDSVALRVLDPYAPKESSVDVATIGGSLYQAPREWWTHKLTVGFDHASGAIPPGLGYPANVREPLGASDETANLASARYFSEITTPLFPSKAEDSAHRNVRLQSTAGLEFSRLSRTRSGWQAQPDSLSPALVRLYSDVVTTAGAYLKGMVYGGRFSVNAGTRLEWNSAIGGSSRASWAPAVGAAYTTPMGQVTVKFRGSWGRGLRAPDPIYSRSLETETRRQLANSSLGAETQSGFEGGVDVYAMNDESYGFLRITGFTQRAVNLVSAVQVDFQDSVTVYQFQNVGSIRNSGIEIEAHGNRGNWAIDAKYYGVTSRVYRVSRTYTGFLAIGDLIPEVPRSSGTVQAIWSAPKWAFAVGATFLGSWKGFDWAALENVSPPPEDLEDYVIDYPGIVRPFISVGRLFSRRATGYLNIDNIFGTGNFEQHNGYPQAGRSLAVGLEVRS